MFAINRTNNCFERLINNAVCLPKEGERAEKGTIHYATGFFNQNRKDEPEIIVNMNKDFNRLALRCDEMNMDTKRKYQSLLEDIFLRYRNVQFLFEVFFMRMNYTGFDNNMMVDLYEYLESDFNNRNNKEFYYEQKNDNRTDG